jgi:hypothetical protein
LPVIDIREWRKAYFDLKPYLDKPVFKQLKNIALFKTARVVSGSVEWQGGVDLSYDTLYLESKDAKEAQSRRKTPGGQREGLAVASITKKKSPKVRISAK